MMTIVTIYGMLELLTIVTIKMQNSFSSQKPPNPQQLVNSTTETHPLSTENRRSPAPPPSCPSALLANSQSANPSTPSPDPEPVHVLVIGNRQGIAAIIHSLHIKGFAQIHEWSPYQNHSSGRLMRILTRYVAE